MSDQSRTRAALQVLVNEPRELEQFDPERFRLHNRALDFTIEEAQRITDWPLLEQAIDAKIAEQHRFTAWWHVITKGKGQRGKGRQKENK